MVTLSILLCLAPGSPGHVSARPGGVAVPSTGAVILATTSPLHLTRLLLAQGEVSQEHPDPEEERALEQDMEEARRRIAGPKSGEATPNGPSTQDESYPGEYPEAAAPAPLPPRVPRLQDGPTTQPIIEFDGRGQGYYLGWGIADWILAGSMWVVSALGSTIGALVMIAGLQNTQWGDSSALVVGTGMVLGFTGLGVGGAFVARRGAINIAVYRDMKAGRVPEDW